MLRIVHSKEPPVVERADFGTVEAGADNLTKSEAGC